MTYKPPQNGHFASGPFVQTHYAFVAWIFILPEITDFVMGNFYAATLL
jgi:hypothetical protein